MINNFHIISSIMQSTEYIDKDIDKDTDKDIITDCSSAKKRGRPKKNQSSVIKIDQSYYQKNIQTVINRELILRFPLAIYDSIKKEIKHMNINIVSAVSINSVNTDTGTDSVTENSSMCEINKNIKANIKAPIAPPIPPIRANIKVSGALSIICFQCNPIVPANPIPAPTSSSTWVLISINICINFDILL